MWENKAIKFWGKSNGLSSFCSEHHRKDEQTSSGLSGPPPYSCLVRTGLADQPKEVSISTRHEVTCRIDVPSNIACNTNIES